NKDRRNSLTRIMTPVIFFRPEGTRWLALIATALALAVVTILAQAQQPDPVRVVAPRGHDWPNYGGSQENEHYSPLAQINRNNVAQLRIAWTFDTGEEGGLQTNPLIFDGVLYGITPSQKVFALNAATGELLWKFDSGIKGTQPDRGLAYWADGQDRRLLVGVMNFLYALDGATGKPIATFGDHGRIDLRENLGREPAASQS